MKIEEAVHKLRLLEQSTDVEVAHIKADEILLACLRTQGYAAVADAYSDLKHVAGFHYA